MDTQTENMPKIVGIKFSKIGKNYYFDASKIDTINLGDAIVVETSRGWQIGELAEVVSDPEILKNASYKPIDRLATPEDLQKRDELLDKADRALKTCIQEVHHQKLEGVKIISSEFSFDEKIISFLYSSESDDQPNFNQIKKTLGREFPNIRLDFHKVGPRDMAKYFGGMGACGLETRCCTQFLSNFDSISIRMAKKQGISLTPSDITGMCDRLRCCLNYEFCTYVDALKNMPRKNKMVQTPRGIGKITDVAPLRNSVYVYIEEVGIKEFALAEVSDYSGAPAIEKTQDNENKTQEKQNLSSIKPSNQNRNRQFRNKKNPRS
jgi:cell fate regulator YaaT (PSP1 superfamily)